MWVAPEIQRDFNCFGYKERTYPKAAHKVVSFASCSK